jgi:hypothetical protein
MVGVSDRLEHARFAQIVSSFPACLLSSAGTKTAYQQQVLQAWHVRQWITPEVVNLIDPFLVNPTFVAQTNQQRHCP